MPTRWPPRSPDPSVPAWDETYGRLSVIVLINCSKLSPVPSVPSRFLYIRLCVAPTLTHHKLLYVPASTYTGDTGDTKTKQMV
jgi:hypothetical protein